MTTILKTENYALFKKHPLNREEDANHVRKLMKALTEDNKLQNHPIIVNKNYEIVSGQHRFKAAMNLGLPIYYIKDDTVSNDHIVSSNMYQKRMTTAELIRFHARAHGKKDYVELENYIKSTGLSAKAAFGLLSPGKKMTANKLGDGSFKMPEDRDFMDKMVDRYLTFVEFCNQRQIRPLVMIKSATFTVAFRRICMHPDFDFHVFMTKATDRWFEIRPQGGTIAWFNLLKKIYNFRNRAPIYADDESSDGSEG